LRIKRIIAVGGVLVGVIGVSTQAWANDPDAVGAVVSGNVTVDQGACVTAPMPPLPGGAGNFAIFKQVQIAGAFVDGTSAYAGAVAVTDVTACVHDVVAPLVGTGTLAPATFGGSNATGKICGYLGGGSFAQAGVVAVAAVNADWNISGSCTTPADADNTLVAVLAVAPLGTLGVGNMDTVGGVVLGAGISS